MSKSNNDVPFQSERDVQESLSLNEPANSNSCGPVINEIDSLDEDNIIVNAQQWKDLTERTQKLEQELEKSREQPVHVGIRCDGCYPEDKTKSKDIIGVRFVCLDCKNFDLCSSCEQKGVEIGDHRRSHNMGKIKKPVGCFWCFYSSKSHLGSWLGMFNVVKHPYKHFTMLILVFVVSFFLNWQLKFGFFGS